MRTTVTIDVDDDVLAVANALTARKGYSLGNALSELARRGLRSTGPVRNGEDHTAFPVSNDAPAITGEDVCHALDDWLADPKDRTSTPHTAQD